mmetsp:Transcript_2639/g.6353  ORF Transcript_2639/g.6353 Transcript_2639/m.6353 type:complete len:251 (+) Transcript_2639:102-854(+)
MDMRSCQQGHCRHHKRREQHRAASLACRCGRLVFVGLLCLGGFGGRGCLGGRLGGRRGLLADHKVGQFRVAVKVQRVDRHPHLLLVVVLRQELIQGRNHEVHLGAALQVGLQWQLLLDVSHKRINAVGLISVVVLHSEDAVLVKLLEVLARHCDPRPRLARLGGEVSDHQLGEVLKLCAGGPQRAAVKGEGHHALARLRARGHVADDGHEALGRQQRGLAGRRAVRVAEHGVGPERAEHGNKLQVGSVHG